MLENVQYNQSPHALASLSVSPLPDELFPRPYSRQNRQQTKQQYQKTSTPNTIEYYQQLMQIEPDPKIEAYFNNKAKSARKTNYKNSPTKRREGLKQSSIDFIRSENLHKKFYVEAKNQFLSGQKLLLQQEDSDKTYQSETSTYKQGGVTIHSPYNSRTHIPNSIAAPFYNDILNLESIRYNNQFKKKTKTISPTGQRDDQQHPKNIKFFFNRIQIEEREEKKLGYGIKELSNQTKYERLVEDVKKKKYLRKIQIREQIQYRQQQIELYKLEQERKKQEQLQKEKEDKQREERQKFEQFQEDRKQKMQIKKRLTQMGININEQAQDFLQQFMTNQKNEIKPIKEEMEFIEKKKQKKTRNKRIQEHFRLIEKITNQSFVLNEQHALKMRNTAIPNIKSKQIQILKKQKGTLSRDTNTKLKDEFVQILKDLNYSV